MHFVSIKFKQLAILALAIALIHPVVGDAQSISAENQFSSISTLLYVRSVERISVLLSGILLIYLGYNLFIKGVTGEASLKAKRGDGKLELLNAAPGLFFGMFGFSLVAIMAFKSVDFQLSAPDDPRLQESIERVLFSDPSTGEASQQAGSNMPDLPPDQVVTKSNLEVIRGAVQAQLYNLEFSEKLKLIDAYRSFYLSSGIIDSQLDPRSLDLEDAE